MSFDGKLGATISAFGNLHINIVSPYLQAPRQANVAPFKTGTEIKNKLTDLA